MLQRRGRRRAGRRCIGGFWWIRVWDSLETRQQCDRRRSVEIYPLGLRLNILNLTMSLEAIDYRARAKI